MTTFRRVAIAALAGFLSLSACGSDAPKTLSGYELSPAPSVGDLVLPEASSNNADFQFKAPTGKMLIVYFGYMSCPDVCPTTLAEVKKALTKLGSKADKVELAMITVDPGRDTGDALTLYVQSFVAGAHALRTDDAAALEATAKSFGASYSVTTTADGTVEVSHSAAMYVVDPSGTIVLTWPFGINAASIASDLDILLSRSAA